MPEPSTYLCQHCGCTFEWFLVTKPKCCPDCGVRFRPDRGEVIVDEKFWKAEIQRVREAIAQRRGDC